MQVASFLVCFFLWLPTTCSQHFFWTLCHLQYGGECRQLCRTGEVNLGLPYCNSANSAVATFRGTCCVALPCWYLGGICRRVCIPIYETKYDLPTTCPDIRPTCCMTKEIYRNILTNTPPPVVATTTPNPSTTTTTTISPLPQQPSPLLGDCGIPTTASFSLGSLGPCILPWVVSLKTTFSQHYCSGVLVSDNTVITVAGCVDGVKASQLILTLGDYDMTRTEPNEVVVQVSSITQHPLYRGSARGFNIAVLKLKEYVGSPCVSPVCLPGINTSPINLGFGRCLLAGWGDQKASKLTVRPVRVYDSNACTRLMSALNINDTLPLDVICSLEDNYNPSGDCRVDGGSMLICPDLKDRYFVFGLVTEYTCVPHSISLYTDISYNSEWIIRHSRRNAT